MAGAGYKLFNTGDVLTAAQVNTFLQEQTVMVFADAAARTTALSGVLSEGMVSYLRSTDALEVYNGSAWVGIAADQTPLTTKGDLFTFSTADARLAVGNNGETLVADSSTSTGLRWQTGVNTNSIINGGFDVWQRGTSIASSGSGYVYTADRWRFVRGNFTTGGTVSRQNITDTTNLPFIQYAGRVQRDSGNTSTQYLEIYYAAENEDSRRFIGQTVTMSFYARAGANFSAASSTLTAKIQSGTGTNQPAPDFTGLADVVNQAVTLTTTWQRFTLTGTVSSSATQLGLSFGFVPVGTAGANDWFEISGVQLELGSRATTFKRAGNTLAGELAACQRYYWRATGDNNSYDPFSFVGWGYSTTQGTVTVAFPVPMRTDPNSLDYANLQIFATNGGQTTISNLTLNAATSIAAELVTTQGSGLSSGLVYRLRGSGTGIPLIGFSAEL